MMTLRRLHLLIVCIGLVVFSCRQRSSSDLESVEKTSGEFTDEIDFKVKLESRLQPASLKLKIKGRYNASKRSLESLTIINKVLSGKEHFKNRNFDCSVDVDSSRFHNSRDQPSYPKTWTIPLRCDGNVAHVIIEDGVFNPKNDNEMIRTKPKVTLVRVLDFMPSEMTRSEGDLFEIAKRESGR